MVIERKVLIAKRILEPMSNKKDDLREYLRREIIKTADKKLLKTIENSIPDSEKEKSNLPPPWIPSGRNNTDIFSDLRMSSKNKEILDIIRVAEDKNNYTTFPLVPESNTDFGAILTLSDRFVGIPEVGSIEMGDHAYESSIDKRDIIADNLIAEYLPDAQYDSPSFGLPCFSIDGRDIGVEENWQRKGPVWSEEEVLFTFVLTVETRTETTSILYGEDPSFLIWAGINYVYAEYDLDKFYDEFFGALTL